MSSRRNQAAKKKAQKRMTGPTCAVPGCSKPPASSSPDGPPHLTCGNLHHLLLMAGRFNPSPLHPYQPILDRNACGFCALPFCSASPFPGHQWCSRGHYLLWLRDFYRSLHPDQICKLSGCTRHVFVDDTIVPPHPWAFCGWRHRQQSVILEALTQRQQKRPPSPPPSMESECEDVPSIKSLLHSLKLFARSQIPPTKIKVDEEFFKKHPWEVLAGERHTCLLIVRCEFTTKGKFRKRVMITKDHYHWKQQGPAKEKSGYVRKYFTYMKRKGKGKEGTQQHDGSLYRMKEYSLEDVESHCLIKLQKEQPSGHGRGHSTEVEPLDQDNFDTHQMEPGLSCIFDDLEDLPIFILPNESAYELGEESYNCPL